MLVAFSDHPSCVARHLLGENVQGDLGSRSVTEQPSLLSSQEIARRLLALERAPGSGNNRAAATAAELQQLCTRVTENLRDTMGDDGCTALLARALARTESVHPSLTSIRRITNGDIVLDNVAAGVESHGVLAVTSALEALFTALADILARLIGEDMALRVMLPNSRLRPRNEGSS